MEYPLVQQDIEILDRDGQKIQVKFFPLAGVERAPLLIVCPGGGYSYVSPREAEPIANAFTPVGVHTLVLDYKVLPHPFPAALLELACVIRFFQQKGPSYHVDPEQIFAIGFSAGAHLALSYGVYQEQEEFWRPYFGQEKMLPIQGLLLAYPVVTAGPFAHRGSIDNLLNQPFEGHTYTEEDVSLELQVQKISRICPLFLWHTKTDESVPVQNSLDLANAVINKFPDSIVEMHIYESGRHGLSLATPETATDGDPTAICPRAAVWIDAAKAWLQARIEKPENN